MLIGFGEKLIDRCIQLIKQRQERRRNVFNDYVGPTYSDFMKLHKNYLESFRKYRAAIEVSQLPLDVRHPVFSEICSDSLFTKNYRAKLWQIEPIFRDTTVGPFTFAIFRYLVCISSLVSGISSSEPRSLGTKGISILESDISIEPRFGTLDITNVPRMVAFDSLTEIFMSRLDDAEKRKEAMGYIDLIVQFLQNEHESVTTSYLLLKSELLKA